MVQRYLAIAAHADDFELFATFTCFQSSDVRVVVVTRPDSTRHAEAEAAAEILGYELFYLNLRDGYVYTADIRGGIARMVGDYQPDILLTHDPWKHYQLHPDHREVGFQTLDAITQARLMCTRVPAEVLLWNSDSPDILMPTDAVVKRKALACYVSQGFDNPNLVITDKEAFKQLVPQEVYG